MGNYYTTSEEEEQTAVLVGLIQKEDTEEKVAEYMEELAFLSETAGLVPQKRFVQKLWKPDPKTFMGSGKIQEIDDYIKEHKIKVVVFDDDLSPSQLRNLEKIFAIKIYDRSLLILQILLESIQNPRPLVYWASGFTRNLVVPGKPWDSNRLCLFALRSLRR